MAVAETPRPEHHLPGPGADGVTWLSSVHQRLLGRLVRELRDRRHTTFDPPACNEGPRDAARRDDHPRRFRLADTITGALDRRTVPAGHAGHPHGRGLGRDRAVPVRQRGHAVARVDRDHGVNRRWAGRTTTRRAGAARSHGRPPRPSPARRDHPGQAVHRRRGPGRAGRLLAFWRTRRPRRKPGGYSASTS